MKKLARSVKSWSPTRTRPYIVIAGVFAIATMVFIIVGGVISGQRPAMASGPLTEVLRLAAEKKSATYITMSNELIVTTPGDKQPAYTVAKVPAQAADMQINQLIEKGVNVTTYNSYSKAFPTHKGDWTRKVGLGTASGTALFLTIWAFALYRKNQVEAQANEEKEKATAGPGTGEALINYENPDTTFADVAGCEEAVDSLGEIADFLKNPSRYQRMGVRVPKGAVMSGDPGNGKQLHKDTLLPTYHGGFITVGEAKVGDVLINEKGKPTTIQGKYRPMENDLFEIKFSDGTTVKCGGSHLWWVRNKAQRATATGALRQRTPRGNVKEIEKIRHSKKEYYTTAELQKSLETTWWIIHNLLRKNSYSFITVKDSKGVTSRAYRKSDFIEDLLPFFGKIKNDQQTEKEDYSVFSTRELIEKGVKKGSRRMWSVDNVTPIEYPEATLPLDPYTFGLWLGDGFSSAARICGAIEDLDFYMEQIPYERKLKTVPRRGERKILGEIRFGKLTNTSAWRVNEALEVMRAMGVIKEQSKGVPSKKSIPEIYFHSSVEQRYALLQGILDTDGSVTKNQGEVGVGFSSKTPQLTKDVNRLIVSLGYKTFQRKRTIHSGGKTFYADCITFTPDQQVFRLPRKADILQPFLDRHSKQTKHKRRYIESIVPIEDNPEDYYCFEVDSPNHLFLCTESYIPTHNTLLARALAGEAKVPFFTMAGSEFTEIYVGAGAKRVRELFKNMRQHEKALLFIDEIDAVARKRSSGDSSAGNSETESTLNQLLTEIDGFNNKADGKTIIVLGATNRVDLLDPAITRSGRLERKIEVTNPDRLAREKILKLHAEGKPFAKESDLSLVAARTPGFSGADMATIINEAGLYAVREDLDEIHQKHLDQAIADVAMGKARKSALVTAHDRKITAWHEAGHTVCGYLQEDHDDPVAVSIVPRGPAGGVTWFSGSDEIFMTRKKALAKLVTAFGGRAAEEHILDGEYTQGPSGDFQQATNIAFTMVTKYGMTDVGFQTRDDRVAMSNEAVTAKVEELLADAHKAATKLLKDNMPFMEAVVELLLEQDDVSYAELEGIADRLGVKHERTMISVPVLPDHEDPLVVDASESGE